MKIINAIKQISPLEKSHVLSCILVITIMLSSCSKINDSNDSGDPSAAGNWGLTLLNMITGTDTTSVPSSVDSSIQYLSISGTDVLNYYYIPPLAPIIKIGSYSYAGKSITLDSIKYKIEIEPGKLLLTYLNVAGDTSIILQFESYSGSTPPTHWSMGSATIQDDNYEPDGDSDNATLLSSVTQSHTISSNDIDYFRLSLSTGFIYTITIEGDPDNFNVNNNIRNSSTDEDSSTTSITISPTSAFTGNLSIIGNNSGTYTISMSVKAVTPSPFSGNWYLFDDERSVSFGNVDSSLHLTYTIANTPIIVEFLGQNIIIMHQLEDGVYSIDTIIYTYVDNTILIEDGVDITINLSGGNLHVEYVIQDFIIGEINLKAAGNKLQDRNVNGINAGPFITVKQIFGPYTGPVPPRSWPPESEQYPQILQGL